MRETGTTALFALVFCCCSVTKGDHGPTTPPHTSFVLPTTSSSSPNTSTTTLKSLVNSTGHLSVSSEEGSSSSGVPANTSLTHGSNSTSNSTRNTIVSGPTHAPAARTMGDITSVPVNITESRDKSVPETAGVNQNVSSPPPATVMVHTILPFAPMPTGHTSTSSPPMESHPSPAHTSPGGTIAYHTTTAINSETATKPETTTSPKTTASPAKTTAQIRHTDLTVSTKNVTIPATISIATTQTPDTSKVYVNSSAQSKGHAGTPSELNVGDEESSASLDPLLAGLVSVFVVTAAIISLLLFLKFRHRNERPEFRRLQDLPMDDMLEDTPLSMYSY